MNERTNERTRALSGSCRWGRTLPYMGTTLKSPREGGKMRPTRLWEATGPGRTRTWQVAGPWEPGQQCTRKSKVSEQAREASWRRRRLNKTGSCEGYLGGRKEPESLPGRRVSEKHMFLSSNGGAENQDLSSLPHDPRTKARDGERPAARRQLPQKARVPCEQTPESLTPRGPAPPRQR